MKAISIPITARDRDVLLREHVPDADPRSPSSRRDLLELPPFYTGSRSSWTPGRVERFPEALERAERAKRGS